MENWEEEFSDQFFVSTEGRNDIRREKIKKLILQIRQDTLRQVLDNHKVYISYLDETGILVEDIKRKAKEIWGIELNK